MYWLSRSVAFPEQLIVKSSGPLKFTVNVYTPSFQSSETTCAVPCVIIGEVVFSRIFRNFALKLLSVALGAVIYYIVIQFVLTAGLNTNDLKLITALVVAIFLAIPYWKGKYFRAAVKTKKEGR